MSDPRLQSDRDVAVDHGDDLQKLATARLSAATDVAVLRDGRGRAFTAPILRSEHRRARPGDGAAEALVRALAAGTPLAPGFDLITWQVRECAGESGITVDQTNESVIVGDTAVVKWSIEATPGPHPALQRLATLVAAEFTDMPAPWGALTWQEAPGRVPRLLATIVEYLPGACDGWEWAVADTRTALSAASDEPTTGAARSLGGLVARMHDALATAGQSPLSPDGARRLADDAHAELDEAVALTDGEDGDRLRARADDLHARLDALRSATGTPVIDVHGDLHVGQVLRADGRYAVVDFDGNPVLSPAERIRRQPAATDVAGMLQSLDNVGHVVARRTGGVDAAAVSRLTAAARSAFLDAYRTSLQETDLLDDRLLDPLRIRQICREYLYAAKHLRRWRYVPDAALAALDI